MVSLDGSSTELKITEKERTCKLLLTFSKPSSEKMSRDYTRSKLTEVSDTDGALECEVNTPKPQDVVESLWVWKERRNDYSCQKNIINNQ